MGLHRRMLLRAAGSATLVAWLAPLLAAAPAGCGVLCGNWQLEPGTSDDARVAVDTAVAHYKPPRVPRMGPNDLEPPPELLDQGRTPREELREELQSAAAVPGALRIEGSGSDILLSEPPASARRFRLDEPYSRIDANGIATVRARWNRGALDIEDRYARSERTLISYALERESGKLVVTHTIRRQRVPAIVFRSVYIRSVP